MMDIFHARYPFDISDDRMEIKILGGALKKDVESGADDDQASHKCLEDMPERSFDVQVLFLSLVEKSKRNEFRHEPSECHEKHRTGSQVNRIKEAHHTHPKNEDGHSDEEEAVEESTDNFGANEAVGLESICFPLGEVTRDKSNEHPADGGECVECIRDDGDGACPESDAEFDQEVNPR